MVTPIMMLSDYDLKNKIGDLWLLSDLLKEDLPEFQLKQLVNELETYRRERTDRERFAAMAN